MTTSGREPVRDRLPSYAELLERVDGPKGSTWGCFGEHDELGTINFITPDARRAAMRCVRDGDYFNLDYGINTFNPPLSRRRTLAEHHIYALRDNQRDDYLDSFYMQAGSQIDGLRHRVDPVHGLYNGVDPAEVVPGNPTLGISRYADFGLVGRGVLVDLAAHAAQTSEPLDHRSGTAIGLDMVIAALKRQGTARQAGDLVLLHTGWASYYLALPDEARAKVARGRRSTGLRQGHDVLEWLWDTQVSVLAADNLAVEVTPAIEPSPFVEDGDFGLMHQRMISRLGLCLGELWRLDELAQACAAKGRWEFLVACKPLSLVGGVGSPANAFALM